MRYDNFLKANLTVFHRFLRKVTTQWGQQNVFPKGILVDFGYVKVDKITLQMVPISFIFKFVQVRTYFDYTICQKLVSRIE